MTEWVKDCQPYVRAKETTLPTTAMHPILVPQQWFSHIHVAFIGPLPVFKEGFQQLFTIINRSSRTMETVPLTNIETETCRHWAVQLQCAQPPHLGP